jgi:aminopeptidase N
VTPRRWSDLWLNEGPATYFAAAYAAQHGGLSLAEQVHRWYVGSDSNSPFDHPESDQQLRDRYGPPAAPRAATTLYSQNVYTGGALALYALRQRVGESTFDAIMRTWVSEHRDGNAVTTQFIHAASRVAGHDLSGLLTAWLYAPTSPPLPQS